MKLLSESFVVRLSKNDRISDAVIDKEFQPVKSIADLEEYTKKIKEESYDQGYVAGRESVKTEAEETIGILRNYCNEYNLRREKLLKEAESDVLDLAVQIAEVIIGENIKKESVVKNIVENAIQQVRDKRRIKILVNENDLDLIEKYMLDELTGKYAIKEFSVLNDPMVSRGGCVIETTSGNVDARTESQLEWVREQLTEKTDIGMEGPESND